MKQLIKFSSILAAALAATAVAFGVGLASEVQSPAARYLAAESQGFNALATQKFDAPICATVRVEVPAARHRGTDV